MTIGERIRHVRSMQGMTQAQLAAESEIHPVSIRKYETDAMKPQPEQIRRIARALRVSYFALAGLDSAEFDPDSKPDMMSLLMILMESDILSLSVEPSTGENYGSERNTYRFGGMLGNSMYVKIPGQDEEVRLSDLELRSDGLTAMDLFRWRELRDGVGEAEAILQEVPSEKTEALLKEARNILSLHETDIQAHALEANEGLKAAIRTRCSIMGAEITRLREEYEAKSKKKSDDLPKKKRHHDMEERIKQVKEAVSKQVSSTED